MISYTARNGTNAVTQDWDGMIISPDDHPQWDEYQSWLAGGGIVNPPAYEYIGPTRIALWSLRSALRSNGDFDKVNADIQSSSSYQLRDFWEYGNFLERDEPIAENLRVILGYTREQMDQLFIEAAGEQP